MRGQQIKPFSLQILAMLLMNLQFQLSLNFWCIFIRSRSCHVHLVSSDTISSFTMQHFQEYIIRRVHTYTHIVSIVLNITSRQILLAFISGSSLVQKAIQTMIDHKCEEVW